VNETSTDTVWRGIAATGGVVKVHVRDGSTPWETRFTVTNRRSQWKDNWDYRQTEGLIPNGEVTISTPYVGVNCPQQFPDPVECYVHSGNWVQPDPGMEPGYTATPILTGPNQTYWFPTDIRYNMKRFGALHPGILSTSPNKHPVPQGMLTKACKTGLGIKNAASATANMNQFTHYCGSQAKPGYDMNLFIAAAWGHEGRGVNGGHGHQSLGEQAADELYNAPYPQIEEAVFPDSAGLAEAVNILVVPIADRIDLFTADDLTRTTGPRGNWTPTPGQYMYFWEPQPGGGFAWTPYPLERF